MASSKPLFPGDSEIDELFRIFRVRGTPNDHVWPGVSRLPNYKPKFPQWHEQRLDKAAPALAPSEENGGDAAIDLLAQMLTYAPARRITCRKALDHAFFQPPRLDRTRFAASTAAFQQWRPHDALCWGYIIRSPLLLLLGTYRGAPHDRGR